MSASVIVIRVVVVAVILLKATVVSTKWLP